MKIVNMLNCKIVLPNASATLWAQPSGIKHLEHTCLSGISPLDRFSSQVGSLSFRSATLKDLQKIKSLAILVYPPNTANLKVIKNLNKQFSRAINLADNDPYRRTLRVCESSGKTIGMAYIYQRQSGEARLELFSIAQDMQKKGIGKAFIKEVERYCKAKGYLDLTAECSSSALGFYKKQGFQVTQEPKSYGEQSLYTVLKSLRPSGDSPNMLTRVIGWFIH